MNAELELTLPTRTFTGLERMRYETPSGGITLTGYIVRRLHKTALLEGITANGKQQPALALLQFGIYALAAATSWGPALYQPDFGRPGAVVSEADPDTGALVTAQFISSSPHYTFHFEVRLPDGGLIEGRESITGTTVGLSGLGMPAPSTFTYSSPDGYEASAVGTINSELAPRLFQSWQIRGYGSLQLGDNQGSTGRADLNRSGLIAVEATTPDGTRLRSRYQMR
ncbi:MAG: hypothetical protein JNJ61_09675 [Anaerolineae bacterium]|nr:hypothetical protein [Anaerolineae bacterium]